MPQTPLTKAGVKGALDEAMGLEWSDAEMEALKRRLLDRFPKRAKTIENAFEWAGDNSNLRAEGDEFSDAYDRTFFKVMGAINRLPW